MLKTASLASGYDYLTVLSATDKNGSVKREFDALNRVIKYTDTYGNTIGYRYDSIGLLTAEKRLDKRLEICYILHIQLNAP